MGDRAPAFVNVNVSARQLRERGFADEVARILAETGVPPHRLTLEITESTAVSLGPSVTNLDTLRALGVRIALDDFGTGQSTLSLLQEFPVDELKLDRSFTQADSGAHAAPGSPSGPRARRDTMAAAVIQLARVLDLHVVAEGVETPAQAERLRVLGYPAAQGYLFARPMSAADIEAAFADAKGAFADHEAAFADVGLPRRLVA
jgi:EAL domain-containing protein (putative c-di-GMP-specific phosphodiesterase class I)